MPCQVVVLETAGPGTKQLDLNKFDVFYIRYFAFFIILWGLFAYIKCGAWDYVPLAALITANCPGLIPRYSFCFITQKLTNSLLTLHVTVLKVDSTHKP